MKQQRQLFVLLALMMLPVGVMGQSIFNGYAIVNDSFYDLNATSGNPDFNGADLGSFQIGSQLKLGGQTGFWSDGQGVEYIRIAYRIYPTDQVVGAFSFINYAFQAYTAPDDRWGTDISGSNVSDISQNVLSVNLPRGTYTLEVYVEGKANNRSSIFANNSGANYKATFTVTGGLESAQNGNWGDASTWVGNLIPTSDSHVIINHDVTLDVDASVRSLKVNSGKTFSLSDTDDTQLTVTSSNPWEHETVTIDGNIAFGSGISTILLTGAPSSGDAKHKLGGSGANLQRVVVNKTSGSSNVGLSVGAGYSVSNALRVGSGGYIATAPPSGFYGANATLEFNTGANYDVNPGDNTWSTTEVPSSIKILSGTVTVNQARSFSGSLTIESGATLVTNGNVTGLSGSNLVNNGTVTGNLTFQRTISNSIGWRMMSSPVSTSYSDLLAEVWTQGASVGADVTHGTANVQTYSGSAFSNVTDLSASITAGQGFIYYHFNDDNYDGTPNSGSTILSVTGTEQSGATVNVPANGWALAGNPFSSSLDWDLVTKNNVEETVYVYDANYTTLGSTPDVAESGSTTGNYRAWNGVAGSLTDGLIAPFQGFWVDSKGESSSIVIETADKTTSGIFRGKEVESSVLSLALKGRGMQSEAFLQFSDSGELTKDGKDAYKLRPLSEDFALLYTQLADGTTLDINHMPVPQDEVRIPLGVDVTRTGEFEMFLSSSSVPEGWTITLYDEVTDTETRLDRDTRYRFTESRMAKRGNAVSPEGPMKVLAATSPRFTLIIDPTSSTSTKDDGRGTMDDFQLEQNYPNPFNPSTQIRFALGASGLARLTVYDVLGREVATLVNGALPAGSHSVTFDASNLTSGVYLYKLEAGGMSVTKRMTLVK